MGKCILIIGVRRACYQAAMALGYKVVLWSDGPLAKQRQKGLLGWIEEPYGENKKQLSPRLISQLAQYKIIRVIANTEEAVVIGARVRQHLGLKRLAVDVTERFHDKLIMKNTARDMGIPITKYMIIDENTTAGLLADTLGLPLVVKPVDESGAQDVKIAKTKGEIGRHMKAGFLAEAFVEGPEVSVETFVRDGQPIFHNITEYLHQWRKSVAPAALAPKLAAEILRINDEVIGGFGVDRGMTHAEFYLTKKGPVFGEIAIRPPGGYYMNLIERVYGFDPWKAYVTVSCGKDPGELNRSPQGCAGVYMMHPGAGTIKSIQGVDEIKQNVKGIFEMSIRKKAGDRIAAHDNTSNEVGHILFWAPDRQRLNAELEYIESTIFFDLEV